LPPYTTIVIIISEKIYNVHLKNPLIFFIFKMIIVK